MSEIKRRTFLNEPGEQLLLTSDPVEYIRRFDDFIEASGLPAESLLATPLIGTPLPVAKRTPSGGIGRWVTADPAFMWHPLMWLPQHLALRYRYRLIDDQHGGTSDDTDIESDSIWAIRVALELVNSGLYNPDDGTWVDVLALHGLDVENPVDQARVELWLKGSPDEVLDSIDLTDLVRLPGDPEWALRAAADLAEVLVPAEWSLISAGIIEAVEGQVNAGNDSDWSLRALLNVMSQVAAQALHDVPADPETGVDYIDLVGIVQEAAQDPTSDIRYLLDTFLEALGEIAADYLPSLQAITGSELALES